MDDPGARYVPRLEPDQLEALVETMYLVAFADGRFGPEQRNHFERCVSSLTDGRMAGDGFAHVIDRVSATPDRDQTIASLRHRLPTEELRQIALILATDMAAADGVLHPEERHVVNAIAEAFDMDEAAISEVFEGPDRRDLV
jgi:tellurite resistance protein